MTFYENALPKATLTTELPVGEVVSINGNVRCIVTVVFSCIPRDT